MDFWNIIINPHQYCPHCSTTAYNGNTEHQPMTALLTFVPTFSSNSHKFLYVHVVWLLSLLCFPHPSPVSIPYPGVPFGGAPVPAAGTALPGPATPPLPPLPRGAAQTVCSPPGYQTQVHQPSECHSGIQIRIKSGMFVNAPHRDCFQCTLQL